VYRPSKSLIFEFMSGDVWAVIKVKLIVPRLSLKEAKNGGRFILPISLGLSSQRGSLPP